MFVPLAFNGHTMYFFKYVTTDIQRVYCVFTLCLGFMRAHTPCRSRISPSKQTYLFDLIIECLFSFVKPKGRMGELRLPNNSISVTIGLKYYVMILIFTEILFSI